MRQTNLNIFVAVCTFVMALTAPVEAVTRYVSPGQSIQAAMDASSNGDEIEVAPGTYHEAIDFKGKAVRLYSSGGPELTTINDPAYHCAVKCVSGEDPNTVLEGFTVTGANRGLSIDSYTTGMFNNGSSPTIRNCIFSDNIGFYGGGMLNYHGSNPTVTNCTFNNNESYSEDEGGAGMGNLESSPKVTDCTFSSNRGGQGTGMFNLVGGPIVTNCTFSGNWGTGMTNEDRSSPTVTNCIFSNNLDRGMFNYYNSSPTVTNCIFTGNSAYHGAGMYNIDSSPTVSGCTFSGNTAGGSGGGMYNLSDAESAEPTVTNCTFSLNSANNGGGMFNYRSSPTVTNCILWGDTPYEIHNENSSPIVTYSDIQGGYSWAGNIDADPCFVDSENPDPNLWNLRLKLDSPCIDAGFTILLCGPLDIDGYPRAIDDPQTPNTGRTISDSLNVVDMGAYEFQPCRIEGDNNCDGVVDFKDLAILCNNWLAGTEPEL